MLATASCQHRPDNAMFAGLRCNQNLKQTTYTNMLLQKISSNVEAYMCNSGKIMGFVLKVAISGPHLTFL